MSKLTPWICVDLDGTLAHYGDWVAWNVIGKPIPLMLERVKKWIAEGKDVRIFTARVGIVVSKCVVNGQSFTAHDMTMVIQDWCEKQGLPRLQVTATKDYGMAELWDDRCIQVVPNTGRTLAEEHEAELTALRGKP